jgi:hypothetical protein
MLRRCVNQYSDIGGYHHGKAQGRQMHRLENTQESMGQSEKQAHGGKAADGRQKD